MNDEALYSLLCDFKTKKGTLLRATNKGLVPVTTPRCLLKAISLADQACKERDGEGLCQLLKLLLSLLPYKNYNSVDDDVIVALRGIPIGRFRGSKYQHRCYTLYLEIILGVLDLTRTPPVSHRFAAWLFSLVVEGHSLEYDIRFEAARMLNEMLDSQGPEFLKFLSAQKSVQGSWLGLGTCVLVAGDIQLQTSLVELMCRLFRVSQRTHYAPQIFTKPELRRLLIEISDDGFERDCRVFLNVLNSTADKKMVYSFKCEKVKTAKGELAIPEHQQWLDVNFGSQSLSIYVNSADGEGEYETLVIRPSEIEKHEHALQGGKFHLALQLTLPVSALLESEKGTARSLHFVLEPQPDPKGPILGLIGQQITSSLEERKAARVAMSVDCISISDSCSSVVSRPTKQAPSPGQSPRAAAAVQSVSYAQPLPASQPVPVSQPLPPSQPPPHSEPTPPASPPSQPILASQPNLIAETLPMSAPTSEPIPETQRVPDSCPQEVEWLSSSFDYTNPQLDDSGLELNDTIQDMLPNVTEEETSLVKEVKRESKTEVKDMKQVTRTEEKIRGKTEVKNLQQESHTEEKIRESKAKTEITSRRASVKAEVKKEKTASPAAAAVDRKRGVKKSLEFAEPPIICVGGTKKDTPPDKITIKNTFGGRKTRASLESSPDLEVINSEIVAQVSEPPVSEETEEERKERSFKRKLMNAEDKFLGSQSSPYTQRGRNVEKMMNSSAGFILSRNRKEKKEGELVVVDESPAKKIRKKESDKSAIPGKKSILKKKFLDKSQPSQPLTPDFKRFDFNLHSPSDSDNSWGKTRQKKKLKGGFKTKKEKQAEERRAKKALEEKEKEKKLLKKRRVELTDEDVNSDDSGAVSPRLNDIKVKPRTPTPPPPTRGTRASARRAAKAKKICYKEPGSDSETTPAPSEYSTTTSVSTRPLPPARTVIPSTDRTGIPFSMKTTESACSSLPRTREPSLILETRVLQDITPGSRFQNFLENVRLGTTKIRPRCDWEAEATTDHHGLQLMDVIEPAGAVEVRPAVKRDTVGIGESTAEKKTRRGKAAARGAAAAAAVLEELQMERVEESMLEAEVTASKKLYEKVYQRKRKRSKPERAPSQMEEEAVQKKLEAVQEMLDFINTTTRLDVEVSQDVDRTMAVDPDPGAETSPGSKMWLGGVSMRPIAEVTEAEIVAQFRELTDCMAAGGGGSEEIEEYATPPVQDPFSGIVSRALGQAAMDSSPAKENFTTVQISSPDVNDISPLPSASRIVIPTQKETSPLLEEPSPLLEETSPLLRETSPLILRETSPLLKEPSSLRTTASPLLKETSPVPEEMSQTASSSYKEPSQRSPVGRSDLNLDSYFQMLCRPSSPAKGPVWSLTQEPALAPSPPEVRNPFGEFARFQQFPPLQNFQNQTRKQRETLKRDTDAFITSIAEHFRVCVSSIKRGPEIAETKGKVEHTLARVEESLRSVQRKEQELFKVMETSHNAIRQNNNTLQTVLAQLKSQIQPLPPQETSDLVRIRKELERGFRERQQILLRKSAEKQRRAMLNKLALFLMCQED